jgi:hypothetical protein
MLPQLSTYIDEIATVQFLLPSTDWLGAMERVGCERDVAYTALSVGETAIS